MSTMSVPLGARVPTCRSWSVDGIDETLPVSTGTYFAAAEQVTAGSSRGHTATVDEGHLSGESGRLRHAVVKPPGVSRSI